MNELNFEIGDTPSNRKTLLCEQDFVTFEEVPRSNGQPLLNVKLLVDEKSIAEKMTNYLKLLLFLFNTGKIIFDKFGESPNNPTMEKKNPNNKKLKDHFEDIPRELLDNDPLAFMDALLAKANEAILMGEKSLERQSKQLAKSRKALQI